MTQPEPTADDFAGQMHEIDVILADPEETLREDQRAGLLLAKDLLELERRKAASAVLSAQEAANYADLHKEIEPEEATQDQGTEDTGDDEEQEQG